MRAVLPLKERRVLGNDRFADAVIWRVPKNIPGSAHDFKYRLALAVDNVCVLRFDNEAGKGDRKHVGTEQVPCTFTTPGRPVTDFWKAAQDWRPE